MDYEYSNEIKEKYQKYKEIFSFYRLKLRKYKVKDKNTYRFNLIKVDITQCLILRQKENVNPLYVFEIIEQILEENNYYTNKLGKVMCFNEEKLWQSLT